jgi:hypothetical protein
MSNSFTFSEGQSVQDKKFFGKWADVVYEELKLFDECVCWLFIFKSAVCLPGKYTKLYFTTPHLSSKHGSK